MTSKLLLVAPVFLLQALLCYSQCPHGWVQTKSRTACYRAFFVNRNHAQAQALCASQHGSILPMFKNGRDIHDMRAVLRRFPNMFHLGANAIAKKNKWVLDNPGNCKFWVPWDRGQPQNKHEKCAVFYKSNNKVHDYPCGSNRGLQVVCQIRQKNFGCGVHHLYDVHFMSHDIGLIENLGCWRDTARPRAIPGVDCLLGGRGGNYKHRKHAIHKCAAYARQQGHGIFAVQNGGWCATSAKAADTYRRYGPAENCGHHGKGGYGANQVYRIHPIYKDLGCWVDTMNRAIPPIDHMLGGYYRNRKDAIHKCGALAAKMGFSVFAVQHGGWCAASKNAESTYNMYGPSTQCHKNGKGGPWANQVYKIQSRCDQNWKIVNLGCWKDTGHRAIAPKDHLLGGHYRKRRHAWDKCRRLAMKLGNNVFALQHSGWCATSKNAEQTYTKYGPARNCGRDGEGGAWANQVYQIYCD